MQIVIHLGAHTTDEGRLLRSLLKSRDRLAQEGVAVPPPGHYRPLIRDTLVALRGAPASAEVEEALLDTLLDGETPQRLILSNEFLLGTAQRVVSDQGLLAGAGRRAAAIAGLFAGHDVILALGLRNPATLIPAMLARTQGMTYAALMSDVAPMNLRWPPALRDLREAAPEAEIIVWCNEDTPLIWPRLLRVLTGVGPDVALAGDDDMLAALLPADAFARLVALLSEHPPRSADHRLRMTTAFLERFSRTELVQRDIALPGWDAALTERLSEQYEADWNRIRQMPGLRVIEP